MALQKLSEWREAQSKHVCAPSSSLIAETPWRSPGNGGFKCNVDLRNGQAGYVFAVIVLVILCKRWQSLYLQLLSLVL